MMYVVLLENKNIECLRAVIPALNDNFPSEYFYISGSEEKGYKLNIGGSGDEKGPRSFAKIFIKKWQKENK